MKPQLIDFTDTVMISEIVQGQYLAGAIGQDQMALLCAVTVMLM